MNLQIEQQLRSLLTCEGVTGYRKNPEQYELRELAEYMPGLSDALDNIISYDASAHEYLDDVLEEIEQELKDKYETYLHGQCHLLALALHEKFGLPLEYALEYDIDIDRLALQHAWVRWDDTHIVDIGGLRTIKSVEYDFGPVENRQTGTVAELINLGGKATQDERKAADALAHLIYLFADISATFRQAPRATHAGLTAQPFNV